MNAYEKRHQALVALDAWVKVVKNNPKDKTAIECAEFVEETIKAALLEPPRNCDRFDTGDVDKDADDAMRSMLEEIEDDGNFGFRGIASYLLSPSQKKGDEE